MLQMETVGQLVSVKCYGYDLSTTDNNLEIDFQLKNGHDLTRRSVEPVN